MEQYYAVINSTSLTHHGIKGQRWGIRRYQNYDGEYTQEGLAKYRESRKKYEEAKQLYKVAKNDKTSSKEKLISDKEKLKSLKRRSDKDYKELALDKNADKGKERWMKGERITVNESTNNALAAIGTMSLSAAAVASKYSKEASIALAALGATSVSVGLVKKAYNRKTDNELRAYYGKRRKNNERNNDKE